MQAGFVKKSKGEDLAKRSYNPVGAQISEHGNKARYQKPWRLPKIQPLTDDLEDVLDDDSDF
jgi:hypothetical protein